MPAGLMKPLIFIPMMPGTLPTPLQYAGYAGALRSGLGGAGEGGLAAMLSAPIATDALDGAVGVHPGNDGDVVGVTVPFVIEDDGIAEPRRGVQRSVILPVHVEASGGSAQPRRVGAHGCPGPAREIGAPVFGLPAVSVAARVEPCASPAVGRARFLSNIRERHARDRLRVDRLLVRGARGIFAERGRTTADEDRGAKRVRSRIVASRDSIFRG